MGVTPIEKAASFLAAFEMLELPLRRLPATGKPKAQTEPMQSTAGNRLITDTPECFV